jgi:UDP-glucose 4-epimerase
VSYLKTIRNLDLVAVDDYNDTAKYADSLCGVDKVVHLAARVHVLHDVATNPLEEFRRVNVLTTRRLATVAAAAGVRRCVYVSSIKVNGETTNSHPFEPDDPPQFNDPYGQSKWEAEEALREIATSSGMEWAVVRPPLIYGPGVRGNFLALMNITKKGIPIPLGAIVNRRSLVSVFNCVDLLKTMLNHPRAAGNRFLVKDAEDVSTSDLIRHIAEGMKRRVYLVPVPARLLIAMGRLVSREELMTRLCSNLVVSTEKTKNELEWTAPMSLATGIARTCDWFSVTASGRAS